MLTLVTGVAGTRAIALLCNDAIDSFYFLNRDLQNLMSTRVGLGRPSQGTALFQFYDQNLRVCFIR